MRTTALLVLLAGGSTVLAGDAPIEVAIVGYPREVPRGVTPVPLLIEIRNVSGHALTVGPMSMELEVEDGSGQPRWDCEDRSSNGRARLPVSYPPKSEVVPSDWAIITSSAFSCHPRGSAPLPTPPPEVHLQLIVTGGAPDQAGNDAAPAWKGGQIRSEPVRVAFVEPSGVDRDAQGASSSKLLRDYPTSTYAAYVVSACECNNAHVASHPGLVLQSILTYQASHTRWNLHVPDDSGKSKDGWLSLWGDAAAAWCDRWLKTVIDAHPDIWFADQLRLSRAVNALRLGEYGIAADRLRALAKDPKSGAFARRAQEYLSLMAERGMVPEDTPAGVGATTPAVGPAATPEVSSRDAASGQISGEK